MPLKVDVLPLLDGLEPLARSVGAVNTSWAARRASRPPAAPRPYSRSIKRSVSAPGCRDPSETPAASVAAHGVRLG